MVMISQAFRFFKQNWINVAPCFSLTVFLLYYFHAHLLNLFGWLGYFLCIFKLWADHLNQLWVQKHVVFIFWVLLDIPQGLALGPIWFNSFVNDLDDGPEHILSNTWRSGWYTRLQKWSSRNLMMFINRKCRVLYLQRTNSVGD